MATNGVHGNSFQYSEGRAGAKRIPVWGGYIQLFPSGAYATKEELEAAAVNGEVPAGTAVSVDSIGGKITFNPTENITGLLYQGVEPGDNGGTIDIVTHGELYLTRCKANLTEAQIAALSNRITFIKEA